MTEQEMKRLSRAELLEVILLQIRDNEQLKEENEKLQQQVDERILAIDQSGDLAEACLRLNHIFQDAENAVAQYKENIIYRAQGLGVADVAHGAADSGTEQARLQAEQILADARQRAQRIIQDAEAHKARAQQEADAYWAQISQKLEAFLNAYPALRAGLGGQQQ